MKSIVVIVALMISMAICSSSEACGTWALDDIESHLQFRFKDLGVELEDAKRPDPEIMKSTKKGAWFIQGHRLEFDAGAVNLFSFTGKLYDGKREYEKREVARYVGDTLIVSDSTEPYIFERVTASHSSKREKDVANLRVSQANREVIRASINDDCKSTFEIQIRRVQAYLVWKSLKLSPYDKPVENWWW